MLVIPITERLSSALTTHYQLQSFLNHLSWKILNHSTLGAVQGVKMFEDRGDLEAIR